MDFSEKLQTLRREKGLSQEALAELLGVSRQAVSKWESSGAYRETDKILTLCNLFGVTADELLRGAGSPAVSARTQTQSLGRFYSGGRADGLHLPAACLHKKRASGAKRGRAAVIACRAASAGGGPPRRAAAIAP